MRRRVRYLLKSIEQARVRLGLRLRRVPVAISRGVRIDRSARIWTSGSASETISIGENCDIGHGALVATYGGWIRLGRGCSVNPYCVLYGHGGLSIGDHVRIASHSVFIPANHRFDDTNRLIVEQGETREGIEIGNDVWIGAHVTVLDGCRIGNGAVIAAGAVVTGDVEPMSVVAGIPARVIGYRGDPRKSI